MRYRIEDDFETTAERYWRVFFDEEFNREQFAALDVGYVLLEFRQSGEGPNATIVRRMRLTPRRALPRPLARLVGDSIAYDELDTFDATSNAMDVVTTPSILADKVVTRGRYALTVLDERRVRRVWDAECTVSIPLVGGTIEQIIVADVRETYRGATQVMRKWLAR